MRNWINLFENVLLEHASANIINLRAPLHIDVPGTEGHTIHGAIPELLMVVEHKIKIAGQPESLVAPMQQWWTRNYINWCVRHADGQPPYVLMEVSDYIDLQLDMDDSYEIWPEETTLDQAMTFLPEWARDGYVMFPSHADSVFDLADDDDLPLQEIFDYTLHLSQTGQRFDRMSLDDAAAGSRAWHDREIKGDDASGKEVMKFPDGMKFVEIMTTTGLDYESQKCHHCIGRGIYDAGLESGAIQVYSLRNAANKPFVTMAVSGKIVTELQGPFNNPPEPEYREHIKQFLNSAGLRLKNSAMTQRTFG